LSFFYKTVSNIKAANPYNLHTSLSLQANNLIETDYFW
jgi:hypothetical protein